MIARVLWLACGNAIALAFGLWLTDAGGVAWVPGVIAIGLGAIAFACEERTRR